MLWELLGLIYNLNVEVTAVYSDDDFAYHDIVPPNIPETGKINTQKIERKHLAFRYEAQAVGMEKHLLV